MERIDGKRLVFEGIKQNYIIYLFTSAIIAIFELVMFIRASLIGGDSLRLGLYKGSYVFLFVISALGLITFSQSYFRGKLHEYLVYVLMGYCASIAMWAAWVSAIDLSSGNSMIVYYTVIMAMGGLVVIPPVYEVIIIGGSLIIMFIISRVMDFTMFNRFGDFFNFFVFVVFAFIVALRNYQVNKKELILKERLRKLSFVDELTGLYNRRSFDMEIAEAVRSTQKVTMMLIDVDYFKKINDTYGHAMGDMALCTVSRLLKETFGDKVYRYGGDEMAVILYDSDIDIPQAIGKLNTELRTSKEINCYGISAGYYTMQSGDKIDQIISRADDGLYLAKERGRGRAICYGA